MSALTLRAASKNQWAVESAIKVDSFTYRGFSQPLSGLIALTISTIVQTWATGDGGATNGHKLDVRVPNYDPRNDTPISDFVLKTYTTQTLTLSNDDGLYIYAVNAGFPGPAIRVQPDGSWDLMKIRVEVEPTVVVTDTLVVVVNYTLAWTNRTPTLATAP